MVNADTIFIVGTGRSGTHFLTSCLIQHPGVTDLMGGKENPLVFGLSTRLATGRGRRPFDRTSLVIRYRYLRLRNRHLVFLDQSHPNLWNYDLLSKEFPSALWLGLVRDPRAVVASMLNHGGVKRRTEDWESYPFPNPFLGVSEANRDQYVSASLAGRCAWRWASHMERTRELAQEERFVPISYERLVESPGETVQAIWRLAGLVPAEGLDFGANAGSLDKWKETLNGEELEEVIGIARGSEAYGALRETLGEIPNLGR